MTDSQGSNEDPRQERTPEWGEDRITRETPVRDAWNLFADEPIVVSQWTDLREVAELLAERRGVHTAAVVDEQGRLTGIIPLRLLLNEMFLHVAPEGYLSQIFSEEAMEEYGKLSRAESTGELMCEPVYVTMDDTVGDAYARMHENRLEGLPIVDEEMKPIGYVDRLQLLRVWLYVHPEG